jgi:predicted site-specific integrase-resolvase
MARLLTLHMAARRIGVSLATLRAMIRAGEFPQPIRRNARWLRVPPEWVEEYLGKLLDTAQVETK